MKAFTERNPTRLGLIGVGLMTAIVLCVIFFNRGFFNSGYGLSARFASAAGIGKGTGVLVAGVPVGSVSSVAIDGNAVVAHLTINQGVQLPAHTTAAIEVETLLGVVDVTLQPIGGWSHLLKPGALITDTSVPTELYQLQNTSGNLLAKSDTAALNTLVSSLDGITRGKQQQVAEIIKGLGDLTTTVSARSGQVGQLIDSAGTLSSTLADRDQQLTSVIDNLNTVASGLADHSTDLASLIDNIDALAAQTNSLVGQDSPQLNTLLASLHSVLGVVGQHQEDLAEAVSYLGSAFNGFQSVGYSGPNDTPNSWANIYANTVSVANGYGVLGPCGALDLGLDEVLGPDPLACDQQTGPLPGEGTASAGSTATGTTPGQSAATGATGATGALGGLPNPGPDSGISGLSQLLDPLLGGGR